MMQILKSGKFESEDAPTFHHFGQNAKILKSQISSNPQIPILPSDFSTHLLYPQKNIKHNS